MEYEQPCWFPADDPDRLWILVAGRQIPYWEARRWFAVIKGKRRTLPLIAFALCLMYSLTTLSFATVADISVVETAVAASVILVAVVTLSIAVCFLLSYPKKQAMAQFADYDADVKRHTFGVRIALYTNRIEVTTLRGTRTILFSDVELCVEQYDGFLILAGKASVVIRSEDLTPYDLQLIRAYLAERLSPQVMCCKTPAQARLSQPLPIPQFAASNTCLTTACVSPEKATLFIHERRARYLRLCAVILPLTLLIGVMLASLFMITPYFLVDLAIFCGSGLIVGTVWSVILLRLFERRHREPIALRFEPEGLRMTVDGVERFIIKERVWLFVEDSGVTIRFLNRKTLFIPADAVEDMSVLKALAGTE